MPRRKVQRHPNGLPVDFDRCDWEVEREGELFFDRCRRPRKLGYVFCTQHIKMAKERNVAAS